VNRFRKAYREVRVGLARLHDAAEVVLFGDYHATQDKGRRSSPRRSLGSEDDAASDNEKQTVVATTRSQRRNIELAQWIVNCHLASVAKFSFQAHTGNENLDKVLERMVKRLSKAENFDLAKRRSRQEMVNFLEAGRFVDGDIFPAFTTSGRVQLFEGDRIKTPFGRGARRLDPVVDGVAKSATTGEHLGYAVHIRKGSSFVFAQWNPSTTTMQVDYSKRHDQTRGVSPLVTNINRMQDIYEGLDAMAIKTKTMAMFGIAIEGADMSSDSDFDIKDDSTGEAPTGSSEKSNLSFKVEPGLKIETDGRVNTIESKTPHSSYMEWTNLEIQIALLAADIPFSFFDSRKSSYNARYADTQKYERTCRPKRKQLVVFQNKWFLWQLDLEIAAGRLDLSQYPLEGGTVLTQADFMDHIEELVEFIPGGIPFNDPKIEIEAAVSAIAAGLESPQSWCKKHDRDAMELLEQNATYQKAAEEKGVKIFYGKPGQEDLFPEEESGDNSNDEGNNDD